MLIRSRRANRTAGWAALTMAVLLTQIGLVGLGSSEAQPTPRAKCGGQAVTLAGTPGPDVLRGTPRADVIHGFGGDDIIMGLAGNDIICGGGGNDELVAGAGNDRVFAGDGDDKLIGNRGNDRLEAGKGDDTLNGGPGRDTCIGGFGQDRGNSCEVKRAILKKTLVAQRRGNLRPNAVGTFKFRVEKGDVLYVNFDEENTERWDGDWSVTGPTGELADGSSLADASSTFVVPRTAWYTMAISAEDDGVRYAVQVVRAPVLVRQLAINRIHRDRIGIPGENHSLRFRATAGDRIFLDWDNVSDQWAADWSIQPLFGFDRDAIADGTRLHDDDSAIVIPRSGQYQLIVDGDDGDLLNYSIVIRKVTRKVQTARTGQTVTGRIAVPGEVDVLRINGRAGQVVTIDFSGETPRWDGDWELIEVGGFNDNVVAKGSSLADFEEGVALPSTGRYDLVIDGDGDETFTWQVTIR